MEKRRYKQWEHRNVGRKTKNWIKEITILMRELHVSESNINDIISTVTKTEPVGLTEDQYYRAAWRRMINII